MCSDKYDDDDDDHEDDDDNDDDGGGSDDADKEKYDDGNGHDDFNTYTATPNFPQRLPRNSDCNLHYIDLQR